MNSVSIPVSCDSSPDLIFCAFPRTSAWVLWTWSTPCHRPTLGIESVYTAYLGLGSNLGDRLGAILAAERLLVDALAPRGGTPCVAGLFETAPMDVVDSAETFLNTTMAVRTALSGIEILRLSMEIERHLGRTRGKRNSSRIIDIDLLLLDELVVDDPELTLPHPRMHLRRFVLEPLAEIAGGVTHPRLGQTVFQLRESARRLPTPQWVHRVAGADWIHPTAPRNLLGHAVEALNGCSALDPVAANA